MIAVTQEKAVPGLRTFLKYARVELQPPRFRELPQVRKGFGDLFAAVRTQKWRDLTVKVEYFVPHSRNFTILVERRSGVI